MQKWKQVIPVILLAAITVRIVVFCLPFLSNALHELGQTASIRQYRNAAENTEDREISDLFASCDDYNNKIAKQQKTKPFAYSSSAYDDPEYESLLNLNGDGIMGYIEIPSVNVYLPIGHGTSDATLDTMAGHMHGTSLITGGENTHAVITAHTGLQSAKLFDDIDKLKAGDEFLIYVLGETHRYVVDDVKTVLPEEADQYLGVEDGKDYITLYTCTPYGVNDHRLLVRGVRQDTENDGEDTVLSLRDHGIKAAAGAVLFTAIPIAILVTGVVVIRKKRNA